MATPGARPGPAPPGLDALLVRLREAGLPVGASEAIDAALLLRHLTRRGAAPTPERLRHHLRPLLCKTLGDLPRVDAVLDDWLAAWAPALGAAAPSAADAAPEAGGVMPQAGGAPAPPAAPPARRRWRTATWAGLAGAVVVAALIDPLGWWRAPTPADAPPADTNAPATPRTPGRPSTTPAPAPAETAPTPETPTPMLGYELAWAPVEALRPAWLVFILLLPLLALLPRLLARPPPPYITRRRGAGTLTLEAWPPGKNLRRLVPPLAPATGGQLGRHVRGAVELREAYARRPVLDLRRSVQATLARGGWLTLHHRFARLRPAYLVLVQAAHDDELGVLWAQRLHELDARVAIFRFHAATPGAEPTCTEVGGRGRSFRFGELPAPWPEQRLIIIASTTALLDAQARPHPWVAQARLERWHQRTLFTPDEPRDWTPRHVAALEAARGRDAGMFVLPFDEPALDAWSEWLVRGRLGEIVLSEPQLYPRLLRRHEALFVGDAGLESLDPDPDAAERRLQALVGELQAYLGQNGFYWLCACAVPPLLARRLALLLGEEYFRRCGATEAATSAYMARHWRRLVRLPWLRDDTLQMPQWLRLALLARLPLAIQEELREVVRGALGRRAEGLKGADGIPLGFDDPDAAGPAGAPAADEQRHALTVGFVRDGLTAQQLLLRLPGPWQRWLPLLRQREATRHPWRCSWRRLRQRLDLGDAAARAATWRGCALAAAVAALALVALAQLHPADLLPVLRGALLQTQAQPLGPGRLDGPVLALDGSGRRALVRDATSTGRVWVLDLATGDPVGEPLPTGGAAGALSADGRLAALVLDSGVVTVWTLPERSVRRMDDAGVMPEPPRLALSADGSRLVLAGVPNVVWDTGSGRQLGTVHGEGAGWAGIEADGSTLVLGSDGSEPSAVTLSRVAPGREPRQHTIPYARLLALAPDGQRAIVEDVRPADGQRPVLAWRDGDTWRTAALPADLTAGLGPPVFGADGRHLLVQDDDGVHVWQAVPRASPASGLRAELPPGVDWQPEPAPSWLFGWLAHLSRHVLTGPALVLLAAAGAALAVLRAGRRGRHFGTGPVAETQPAPAAQR